jgi:cell division septation protein DedD
MSIVPNQHGEPAPPPARVRTAMARPQGAAPVELSGGAPSGGSYAVQVSSQRSEEEAQAAYRSLQARYPQQLGGRHAMIRRADLGAKGIYFRALVGPFASSEQANGLCGSIKAAGGSCIIQRN